MITDPPSLPQRQRAARLLHELSRPASAAIVAQLPVRADNPVPANLVRQGSALSVKEFWTTVSRLEALGVLDRTAAGLAPDRGALDEIVAGLVADSPLNAMLAGHPRLAPFVRWGRVTQTPTEPVLVDELYDGLAELFASGEELSEADLNGRIAAVHDDPAEVRRALVERGLLRRAPGSGVYRRP